MICYNENAAKVHKAIKAFRKDMRKAIKSTNSKLFTMNSYDLVRWGRYIEGGLAADLLFKGEQDCIVYIDTGNCELDVAAELIEVFNNLSDGVYGEFKIKAQEHCSKYSCLSFKVELL